MTLSFDGIIKTYRSGEISTDFEDEIKRWLDAKRLSVMRTAIKDVDRWTAQLIIVLEIGMKVNGPFFKEQYAEWKAAIGKNWKVDLKEMSLSWK